MEIVKTRKQLTEFNKVWQPVWVDKFIDCSTDVLNTDDSFKVLVRDEIGTPVGTFEFIPYKKDVNTIEKYFHFSSLQEVKNNEGNVYEIDKVAISKEHRNLKNMLLLIEAMTHFAIKYNIVCGVALIQPALCKVLKNKRFNFPIKEVGKAISQNGYKEIPMMLCLEDIVNLRKYQTRKLEGTHSF